MKKRICFITLVILVLSLAIFKLSNFSNKEEKTIDSIKYAIKLDGTTQTDFPAKGNYKVDVYCNDADAEWLYDDWKLAINEFNDNAHCDVIFTSISSPEFLNEKIMNLETKKFKSGMLVKELDPMATDSSDWERLEVNYNVTSGEFYKNEDNSYSNGNSSYTYVNINVLDTGFYRMCYSIPKSSSTSTGTYYRNYININSSITYFGEYYYGSDVTGCYDFKIISPSDIIRLELRYYNDTTTIWFEKTNDYENSVLGYYYEGENPNNYIKYNNELWRIVGVFDENAHGVENKNLVKIIRDESLGILNTNGNNFSNSNLKNLLNTEYKNRQDASSSGACSYSEYTLNCDYGFIGIDNYYRTMIQDVSWKYFINNYSYPLTTVLQYERESTDVVQASIGLISITDFGFAYMKEECPRTLSMSNYGNYSNTCNKNWLSSSNNQLTISNAGSNILFQNKNVNTWQSYGEVRPALYLKANVYLLSGTGSKSDPFIISM